MTEPLRLGIMLPTVGRVVSCEALLTVAQHAEEAGVHSLWVSDHLAMPVRQETPFPYVGETTYPVPVDRNYLEAFTTLAWAGAHTSRPALGIGVCVAPYRHPVVLAKMLGSVELLTGGRLILGLGAGWLKEEFTALELDFVSRHHRTDETIEFLRSCASGHGVVALGGTAATPIEVYVRPYPSQDMPIWVGGNGPIAWERAARVGDMWFPTFYGCSPDVVGRNLEGIKEKAAAAGRGDRAVGLAMYIEAHIDDTPLPQPWDRGELRGPPSYILDVIRTYCERGMSEIVLAFGGAAARRCQTLEVLLDAGLANVAN